MLRKSLECKGHQACKEIVASLKSVFLSLLKIAQKLLWCSNLVDSEPNAVAQYAIGKKEL